MIELFSGDSANMVWTQAAKALLDDGKQITTSRIGNNNEILHAVFSISDPRQKWITVRNPPINPAFALAELVWIINGCRESAVINYWNPALPKYAGRGDNYHGAYGYRIRHHFQFDQLEKAYLALVNNASTRQVVIQIWDPNNDFPDNSGQPVSEDIPCNICSILKIRDNKLEWTQILRSNDIFRGVPYNIVQFTSLQEVLAGWLEIDTGSYNQLSDSLHLYLSDKEIMTISNEQYVYNPDSLSISKSLSESVFLYIYNNMKSLTNLTLSKTEFIRYCHLEEQVKAYCNIMYVVAADAARRRGWQDLAEDLINDCNNPIYKKMWCAWVEYNARRL